MSRKTKKTLNIMSPTGESVGEEMINEPVHKGVVYSDTANASGLFEAFPDNLSQKKTETMSIRLTRGLTDKLEKLRIKTGMSTSNIVFEILDKSIDEVLRVNRLQP